MSWDSVECFDLKPYIAFVIVRFCEELDEPLNQDKHATHPGSNTEISFLKNIL